MFTGITRIQICLASSLKASRWSWASRCPPAPSRGSQSQPELAWAVRPHWPPTSPWPHGGFHCCLLALDLAQELDDLNRLVRVQRRPCDLPAGRYGKFFTWLAGYAVTEAPYLQVHAQQRAHSCDSFRLSRIQIRRWRARSMSAVMLATSMGRAIVPPNHDP